jgi:hypothetical protein
MWFVTSHLPLPKPARCSIDLSSVPLLQGGTAIGCLGWSLCYFCQHKPL